LFECPPNCLSDIGSYSSIIGLVVTAFLFFEARKIRNSFLRRARLPDVLIELREANKKISKHLKNWSSESGEGFNQFVITKALIENIKPKPQEPERKKCFDYIKKLQTHNLSLCKQEISADCEDRAWELYSDLSGLITTLNHLNKDSNWD